MLAGVSAQIQHRVDFRDAYALGSFDDLDDLVARSNLALFQHAKIKSWSMMRDQQSCHFWLVGADADTVTSDPRLGHLE